MKSRHLLMGTLTTLCLAMGAWIYFYEIEGEEERSKAEELSERVFQDERDDVTSLAVQNSHGTFRFAKEGGSWKMTEPLQTGADERKIDDIISAVTTMKTVKKLEGAGDKLAGFKLDNPALRLTVGGKSGEHTLDVGGDTPFGGQFYGRMGDDRVLVVGYELRSRLDLDLSSFRDKQVLKMAVADVLSLSLTTAEGVMVSAQKTGDLWFSTGTPPMRLKAREVEDLLYSLKDTEAKAFVDAGDPSIVMDPPSLVAEFKVASAAGTPAAPVKLTLGFAIDRDGVSLLPAQVQGNPQIWLVDASVLSHLGKRDADLRDKAPFAFDRWETDKIELVAEGQTYTATRKEFDWTVESKTPGWKNDEVTSLMDMVMVSEATRFVDNLPTDLSVYGLVSPAVKLTFTRGTNPPQVYEMGIGADGSTYVHPGEEATLYQMNPGLTEDVLKILKVNEEVKAETPAP